MNNNSSTLALARFPNLANVQVIVVFTIIYISPLKTIISIGR